MAFCAELIAFAIIHLWLSELSKAVNVWLATSGVIGYLTGYLSLKQFVRIAPKPTRWE